MSRRSHSLRALARSASRFRWIRKAGRVREWESFSDRPGPALRFVFGDPDVNTFSYEIENGEDLGESLSQMLGMPIAAGRDHVVELQSDDSLRDYLRARTKGHFETKREPPLGRHVISYAITRLIKPTCVVENGVKHGLGSVVILRALERNRSEGGPHGELISIDPDPFAGWLVSLKRFPDWTMIRSTSAEALPTCLRDRDVGLSISDSVSDPLVTRHEIRSAISNRASVLVVVGNASWNDEIEISSEMWGGRSAVLTEIPRDHPYPGRSVAISIFN